MKEKKEENGREVLCWNCIHELHEISFYFNKKTQFLKIGENTTKNLSRKKLTSTTQIAGMLLVHYKRLGPLNPRGCSYYMIYYRTKYPRCLHETWRPSALTHGC